MVEDSRVGRAGQMSEGCPKARPVPGAAFGQQPMELFSSSKLLCFDQLARKASGRRRHGGAGRVFAALGGPAQPQRSMGSAWVEEPTALVLPC